MTTVLCVGGSRDGETTTLAAGVQRLLAASTDPGLVDVYEPTGEQRSVPGGGGPAAVYGFVGQEPVGDLPPEMLRMPDPGPHQGP